MIITTEGIVLRQRKIANNRRMIVLLTKQYGKISAGTSINEKSRSKAALALRPFTCVEYDIFKGRDSYSINSASVLKSFYSIGEDLDRFMAASAFIDYLDKVVDEGVPVPKIYEMSLRFLESVSRCGKSSETLLYAFIVKTFKFLGVAPELSCCTGCGKTMPDPAEEGPVRFSVDSGGILCEECARQEKSNGNTLIYRPPFDIIGVFRYFESKPLDTFERVELKGRVKTQVREILAEYCRYYLGADVFSAYAETEV